MTKRIFITGASSGLGKATAKLFAEQGWNVIATMRKPENENELDKIENITLLPLDVTKKEQIKSTVAKAISIGSIDVVFNNAGYGLAGVFESITDEQISRQINTNLIGVMHVTREFIPHFRKKKNGLFITTTSIGGLMAFPYFSVYNATKWALEGWSEGLAFELASHGIQVKTVSPGGIATDFGGRSLEMVKHEAYAEELEKISATMTDPAVIQNHSTAEQIAQVVFDATIDGQSKLRYVAGKGAKAMYAQRNEVGDEAFRAGIRKMFLG
jgi:NAD(P)-dependent dehydrogenase (short-subunit alcohol dehydrogenase family)